MVWIFLYIHTVFFCLVFLPPLLFSFALLAPAFAFTPQRVSCMDLRAGLFFFYFFSFSFFCNFENPSSLHYLATTAPAVGFQTTSAPTTVAPPTSAPTAKPPAFTAPHSLAEHP